MAAGSLGIVLALLGLLQLSTAATQHTVGNAAGWALAVNYTQWSSPITFRVGDTLLFPYAQGSHTVLEVNKANYDSCSASNAISNDNGGGNTIVQLSSLGQHFFICDVPGHCSGGMKLEVNVLAAASPSPSPAPSPPVSRSPSSSPSPSPRSSRSPTRSPSQAPAPQAAGPSPFFSSPSPSPAPKAGGLPPTSSVVPGEPNAVPPERSSANRRSAGLLVTIAALAFVVF